MSRTFLPILALLLVSAAVACNDDSGETGNKRVFVTSTTYSGQIVAVNDPAAVGIDAGDSECQRLADAAGLPGTYLAWLSDSESNPDQDFTRTSGEYRLVDDTVIAYGWSDLTDGQLEAPISLDEYGQPAPQSDLICASNAHWVLTGTSNRGEWATSLEDCEGWTANVGPGTWGRNDRAEFWSESCSGGGATDPCGKQAPIFCFEQ